MKEFDKFTTDAERWTWLLENQDKDLIVMLDNDDTFVVKDSGTEWVGRFDGYLGWSDGVISLLESMDIRCEKV